MRLCKSHVLVALITVAFIGCASRPPVYQAISSSANPTQEIEQTEAMLKEAQERHVDVLSPENFADAERALNKAKENRMKGKSNEKILDQVAYSRGWLRQANDKANIARASLKNLTDARDGALKARAPEIQPKIWKKTENDLKTVTTAIEDGNLTLAERRGNELVSRYRELETMSLTEGHLTQAFENIKYAKKNDAEKKAPKTYSMATMKLENAERLIKSDPRNSEAIRRASQDAVRESAHLVEVTRKVNAGNTEDLVLLSERQQRKISSLQTESVSAEEELQQSQEQLTAAAQQRQSFEKTKKTQQTAEEIRRQFAPNEAEVFAQGGKVMVRLKALKFPSNKATISPKNTVFLSKVEAVLSKVDASKITVEGHSDATGKFEANKDLSQRRAQAVENFLVSRGTVPKDEIESVGVGPSRPISENNTPQGRAQNRRIDLVIETE